MHNHTNSEKKHSVSIKGVPKKLDLEFLEETSGQEDNLPTPDKNFLSELDYDGYNDIEEYDNDAYSSNVENRADDITHELYFRDRPEGESIAVEENVLDKQENNKDQ